MIKFIFNIYIYIYIYLENTKIKRSTIKRNW